MAQQTEAIFWTGSGDTRGLRVALADHASGDEIRGIVAERQTTLDEGKQRLGADRPGDASTIFDSVTIVFCEGLEGVLILASLKTGISLGRVVRGNGQPQGVAPTPGGSCFPGVVPRGGMMDFSARQHDRREPDLQKAASELSDRGLRGNRLISTGFMIALVLVTKAKLEAAVANQTGMSQTPSLG